MRNKAQQLQLHKQTMSKNTLVDILFDRGIQPRSSHKLTPAQHSTNLNTRKQQKQKPTATSNNRMIKITQFNSSIVISQDRLMHKQYRTSYSLSPHKPFILKKMSEFKNKMMQNAQKYVQIQLNMKNKQPNLFLKETQIKFSHNDLQSDNKLLASNKWTFKQDPIKTNINIPILNTSLVGVQSIRQSSKNLQPIELCQKLINKTSKQLFSQNKQPKKVHPIEINSSATNTRWTSVTNNSQREGRKMSASPRKRYVRQINDQKKYQQSIQNQKKQILELKKQLNRNYAKPFNPPENITASAYIIYEANAKKNSKLKKLSPKKQDDVIDMAEQRKMYLHSHKVVVSLNSRTQLQIASLTKIMTCILAIDLAKHYCLNLSQQFTTIGLFEQNIGGTSAHIKKGQIYSIEQLLYGLMLPSGNDASLAIAVWGGKLLLHDEHNKRQGQNPSKIYNQIDYTFRPKKRQSYQRFVLQMNNKANELGMQKTKYCNSHGLSNSQNRSCAFDLCILCEYAMNNLQFRHIVGSKIYESQIKIEIDDSNNLKSTKSSLRESKKSLKKRNTYRQGEFQTQQMKDFGLITQNFVEQQEDSKPYQLKDVLIRAIKWQNTHQLLQQKSELYIGIKTGITNTAGPCLASCIEINNQRFILIVLNCKSMKYRIKDTQILRKWLFHKQSFKYSQKADRIQKEEKDFMQLKEI